MVATIVLACGVWALVRTYGVSSWGSDLAWRWAQTPEERLLAEADEPGARAPAPEEAASAAEWPGFRGPGRDAVVPGTTLAEDWTARPPRELWRIGVGPGWSSMAVVNDRVYTTGNSEEMQMLICLDLNGREQWRVPQGPACSHGKYSGARSTPTVADRSAFWFARSRAHPIWSISGRRRWPP